LDSDIRRSFGVLLGSCYGFVVLECGASEVIKQGRADDGIQRGLERVVERSGKVFEPAFP